MPLQSLKPTSKSITLLIAAAAILFFAGLFVYVASSGKVRAASSELEAKQKEVEESRKIADRLQDAEAKFVQTKAQLQYLEKSVSQQAYVPTLLKQLEGLGKQVNLRVVSVRPVSNPAPPPMRKLSTDSTNPEVASKEMDENAQKARQGQEEQKPPEKPYQPLEINIEVEGTYQNAMGFLYKITSFPKIMTVNYIQVQPVAAMFGMSSPRLSVRLNLTAYVFRVEDQPAIPESGATKEPPAVTSQVQPDWRSKNEAG